MIRRAVEVAAAVGAIGLALLMFAPAALASSSARGTLATAPVAHPLGNFTINHHTTLRLAPGALTVDWVLDLAEIATIQNYPDIDADSSGSISAEEAAAWVAPLAESLRVEVDGAAAPLVFESAAASEAVGQGGLAVLRIEARFTTLLPEDGERAITFADDTFATHLGWREIIAVAAPGATLTSTDVPGESMSDALRAYPDDRLGTPPDVRDASLVVALEHGAVAAVPAAMEAGTATPREGSRWSFTELARLDLSLWTSVGGLAVAILWGALHALAPGHGKTLMAAYLVGTRARRRDTLLLAGTVSVAHTAGVLILGVVVLAASSAFAPETVYPWLTLASGVMLAGIGLLLTMRRLSERGHGHHEHAHHGHGHPHPPGHSHDHVEHSSQHKPAAGGAVAPAGGPVALLEHQHEHAHAHDDEHEHEHGHDHGHGHHHHVLQVESGAWRTFAAGVAGGLVPSPTALVVFLSANALGRTAFGIALVAAFGVGLAATLFFLGATVGRLASRLETRGWRDWKAVRYLPVLGSIAVLGAGAWLAIRGLLDLA